MRLASYFILLLSLTLSYAQTITIGTAAFNPPFIMPVGDDKKISGFDADIMNEICRRMSATCIYKSILFGDFFKNINDGSINLAIGGITISLDRDKEYIFSLPYLQSYGQYVVRTPGSILSEKDLPGKSFGVISKSVYLTMLKDTFGNSTNARTFSSFPQLIGALINNTVDVLVLDQASANYWVANDCPQCRLLGDRFPYGYGYGILAAKNEDKLISNINQAILSMQSDGTYLKIYSTYF